ncbi:response regulator transcription factor [Nocardioides sp. MH1]|uniref:response regulator transcription factor n=1 Tax=Nocardioides sp. MH1 TaxID=3242490 RepID=UPI003521F036
MSEVQRTDEAAYRHLKVVRVADVLPASLQVGPWTERLSRREADVLRCLADGQSTNEIAATLFISPATVKCHVARLIAKVGVRDRVQLVIAAYRSGFAQVD